MYLLSMYALLLVAWKDPIESGNYKKIAFPFGVSFVHKRSPTQMSLQDNKNTVEVV